MGQKRTIIETLTSAQARLTDFTLFGIRISGRDYGHIANAVRNDQVLVVESLRMPSTMAMYNKALNCFTVGTQPTPSLIVHEATHAINDWHHRSVSGAVDEGICYVAQMIYVLRGNPAIQHAALSDQTLQNIHRYEGRCGQRNEMPCNQATIGHASRIAAVLRNGQTPDRQMIADFERALGNDPFVLGATETRVYNRINRMEIPRDYMTYWRGRIVDN
ncbi:MAG: hypothetical protein KDE55_10010 [Novosphingobium sp.]|nr:hypothetical protein [Novosphingobium sp.]